MTRPPLTPRAPGSQSALRARNRQRLREILADGPATQAQLSRSTGLSPATVSNIVAEMVDAGAATREATTSSGRRAWQVSLTASREVAVGVDIGRRHVRLVAATAARQLLGERFVPLPVGHTAQRTLAVAVEEYRALLEEIGRRNEDVIGVGVGIPGPIDQRSHTVIEGAILPEWVGIDLLPGLERAFNRPVRIGNDANLGALGEAHFGDHREVSNLVYIKVGTGIGAGIVVGGSLLAGALGVSGEIGHMGLQSSDVVCRCGNRGCLETVASTKSLLDNLRLAGRDVSTSEDIPRLAQSGDLAAIRFLEDAGRAIGEASGHLANILGPELIVVGGPLACLEAEFIAPLEASMRRHSVPLIRETVRVLPSSRGDLTEALGAVALILTDAE
ncbi:ROK family transcriptional regulator [Falsarthrobacter nasiphocae]|uniref:NBD/HSP70 family sugar kinase n=1 Tax=Falsarthrobacter nasiphocae TaxID=189863 RepID=A0AAE3YGQ1_9MICC|nr:ROK family transcriptional regulator [Falsarthrobacter nasiphocae]MDR6891686.1 putative NBD/HSP70 family sugar kinase [Falsarthrobacter nasiphocae]